MAAPKVSSRSSGAVALMAGALLLAACAGGPPPDETAAPTPATSPAPEVPTSEPAPVTPPAPPPAPRVVVAPTDLIGLAAHDLETRLGAPGLKRTDPPAEIWQYAHGACTVNVFLYAGGNGTPHRVEHIEAHDKNGDTMDATGCLSDIVNAL